MEFFLPFLNALIALPLTLLPIINPVSAAPVFVSTAGRSEEVVERLARQVAINSWIVILTSMVLGTQVLALFGLSLPVVRIGGGLLVAANGWRMLHRSEQDDVQVAAANQAQVLSDADIVRRSFFPITFPLTTGPGTIAAAIAMGTQLPRSPMLFVAGVAVAMAGAALTACALYFTFKHAATLLDRLGEIGTLVMMRMIAFLLLCIGIQFMVTGWAELILSRGASPLGLPYTLSRAPLRRRAPYAWLTRFRSFASYWDSFRVSLGSVQPSQTQGAHAPMPESRLMYVGIVLIVAAASVWLGAELTRRIEWAVPYVGGAGVLLVVLGVAREFWKVEERHAKPVEPRVQGGGIVPPRQRVRPSGRDGYA